jgi:hypothetical protein
MIFSTRNAGDSRQQMAWRRSISPGSGVTAAGWNGSGTWSEWEGDEDVPDGPREHFHQPRPRSGGGSDTEPKCRVDHAGAP